MVCDVWVPLPVWSLTAASGNVVLSVLRSNMPDDLCHRLVWCPHVGLGEGEGEGEEEGDCLMLAASHGCEVSVMV